MTGYACFGEVMPETYGVDTDFADATQKPLLSAQQHLALMSFVKMDDPIAKQQLIAHNLALVVNIAKRYGDRGMALMDLVREGNMGLIHALENFEREGGFRFSTYAARCVRRNIECAITNQNNRLHFAALKISSTIIPNCPLG